nr:ribonuclease H-like domain-containing protein [Tanacetum cinerariifolium]
MTPYELFRGRAPALSFMRPFGCHVTIRNTLDHLGKFDGKTDEGYFVGYSMNSKALRVYNIRTKRVEENLHIKFLENKPIVAGAGLEWLFDIDMLTKSMNYVPIIAGTNSNDFSSTKDSIGAGQSSTEIGSTQDYLFMPLWKDCSLLFDFSPKFSDDARKKHDKVSNKECRASNELNSIFKKVNTKYPDDPKMPGLETIATYDDSEKAADFTHLESSFHVSPILLPELTRIIHSSMKSYSGSNYKKFRFWWICLRMDIKSAFLYERIKEEVYVCQPPGFEDLNHPNKVYKVVKALYGSHQAQKPGELTFFLELQVKQKEDGIFISQDKYVAEVLRKFNFLDVKSASTLVDMEKTLAKDADGDDLDVHLYRSMIRSLTYLTSSRQTLCIRFHTYMLSKGFLDTLKELYTEFESLMKDKFKMSSIGELTFFLELQVKQKEDGIIISQDKYVAEVLRKFNFLDVKSASTLVDMEKTLATDADGDDIDVHLYRSMIRSLTTLKVKQGSMVGFSEMIQYNLTTGL